MKLNFHPEWIIYLSLLFTGCLIAFRIFYSGHFYYLFLVWNLFLAWIPYALSKILKSVHHPFKGFCIILLWIAFLPNAPYLITDLFHLKQRNNVPLYFDCVMLFSAAWNGLFMGFLSIQMTERWLQKKFGKTKATLVVYFVFVLCSFGIYVGRFLRWNTWDIVFNPINLIQEASALILHPFHHLHTWAVTILFTFLLMLLNFTFKLLPHFMSFDKEKN